MQPTSVTTPKQIRKSLLVMWFAFLTAIGLYLFVLHNIQPPIRDVEAIHPWILGLAAVEAGIVLYLRVVCIGRLLTSATPASTKEIGKLRMYYVLCFGLSLSVALYGFVLRMMGADNFQAAPCFIGAVLLFLICYPRVPDSFAGNPSISNP